MLTGRACAFGFALAVFACSTPVAADGGVIRDPLDGFGPQQLFGGVIRDEDVSLLFDHLRQAVAAAARGDVPPSSEELQRRSEALAGELRLRGTVAALAILNALEIRARDALRTPREERRPSLPPPTAPYTRL